MSDLAAFLLARIAEDVPSTDMRGHASEWVAEPSGLEIRNPRWNIAVAYPNQQAWGYHIARWDPARVLAECEAKRRIVELHRRCGSGIGYCDDGGHGWDDEPGCADLAIAASVYAGHPDFDEAWRL